MAEVEILEVRPATDTADKLRGFAIDSPTPGKSPAAVRFAGWIVGTQLPVATIRLNCQGSTLRIIPVDVPRPDVLPHVPGAPENCGFSVTFTAPELPPEFEMQLVAVLPDNTLIDLATITGRQNVKPEPADVLRPLMVTALGRCGTTFIMRLLTEHPEIVVDRAYPYETNAAAYWLHTFRVLAHPEPIADGTPPFDRGEWTRPPLSAPPRSKTGALPDYFANAYPILAARFCRDAIDGFYRSVQQRQQQKHATYFAEKMGPYGLQLIAANIFPETREIFLVRDFRDMVCSIFAFNDKRGFEGFGRQSVKTDEEYVALLRKAVLRMVSNYKARGSRALLVRYEDMVLHPVETMGRILPYLGLASAGEEIEALARRATAGDPQLQQHRTSSSPSDSIGRWNRDLRSALQRVCRDNFDDLLPEFGYTMDRKGNLVLEKNAP